MTDFNAAVDTLVTRIANDYRAWQSRSEFGKNDERADKFQSELTLNPGRKYMKITSDEVSENGRESSRVWGFVVQVDNDAKFKKGDILMAAGTTLAAISLMLIILLTGLVHNTLNEGWLC